MLVSGMTTKGKAGFSIKTGGRRTHYLRKGVKNGAPKKVLEGSVPDLRIPSIKYPHLPHCVNKCGNIKVYVSTDMTPKNGMWEG